jgi:hypothetical protein
MRNARRRVIVLKQPGSSPYMRNKRHIGNATTIRTTPNLCFLGKHGTSTTDLKTDGKDYWLCGIIGYDSGFLEFEARLLDEEANELDRIFRGVGERVHAMALQDDTRRRDTARLTRRARAVGSFSGHTD